VNVPPGLRTWFIVHFLADVIFAVPLIVAPGPFLGLLGWSCVDPISARLVGAALAGIGVQSWIGRDDGPDAFRAMLNLKVIWSGTATAGIVASQLDGGPAMGWVFAAVFAAFHAVWVKYRLALRAGATRLGAAR
jgi:hypothetical protein